MTQMRNAQKLLVTIPHERYHNVMIIFTRILCIKDVKTDAGFNHWRTESHAGFSWMQEWTIMFH